MWRSNLPVGLAVVSWCLVVVWLWWRRVGSSKLATCPQRWSPVVSSAYPRMQGRCFSVWTPLVASKARSVSCERWYVHIVICATTKASQPRNVVVSLIDDIGEHHAVAVIRPVTSRKRSPKRRTTPSHCRQRRWRRTRLPQPPSPCTQRQYTRPRRRSAPALPPAARPLP